MRGSCKREMRLWGSAGARVTAAWGARRGPLGRAPPGPPGAGKLTHTRCNLSSAPPRPRGSRPSPAGQVGAARSESPESRWGLGAAPPRPLPFCRAARARRPLSAASEPRASFSPAPPPSRCCAAAWPASAAGGSCPCSCSAPSPSTSSRSPAAAGCSRAPTSRRPRCGGDVSTRAAAADPARMAARASWTTVSALARRRLRQVLRACASALGGRALGSHTGCRDRTGSGVMGDSRHLFRAEFHASKLSKTKQQL